MIRLVSLFLITVLLFSCNFNNENDDRIPLARVNDLYLYPEDLKDIVPEGTSKEDSLVIVNNYINRWATKLLLVEGAERNLNEKKVNSFSKLIEQYRYDLYTKAYLEAWVAKNIDTSVTAKEAQDVYEANSETFKLNEELVKLRYINIPQNAVNIDEVEQRFKRFDSIDRHILDSISVQFKSFSLKDSIWVKASQVVQKIPVINPENKNQLLKKSNYIELKDSLSIYLIQINDVLLPNSNAPIEYVKPTINQIVINKRKLELIKQLQKDITKDAIKNNQFEIYENQ
ncbi:hypothetical protein SAMN03097699_1409 [Flavobacteriaceae bacterium MAR_2010_188]|nr:hypothetical protein SAMN03097699_1409 [Flavobacteriaceae bacterium MAR_2010_188]